MADASEPPARRGALDFLADTACIAALILTAWVIYRPNVAVPLDLLDFGEFLPVVRRRDGVFDGIAGLLQYFASQGRANLGVYAYIAANWRLFGLDSAGWQQSIWAVMALLTAMVYLLGRTLGAARAAATLAAGLFVVATPAAGAWVRLTGEPLATICFVGALILAIRYHRVIRWEGAALGVVLLLTAMMLTKEILICLVPIVLLIAWYGDRLVTAIDGRLATLLASTGIVAMLCLVWSAWALLTAPQQAYARSYGVGMDLPGRLGDVFLTILLPQRAETLELRLRPLAPANFLFLLAVVSSWLALLIRRSRFQAASPGLILAGALLTVGPAAYWPWPRFEGFYAIPFLVAPAALVAVGLTEAARGNRVLAAIAYAAMIASTLLSAADAHRIAERTRARRTVESAAAGLLATYPMPAVLARAGLAAQPWQQTGPTMRRYAAAMGWRWLPLGARDVTCDQMESMDPAGPVVRVVYVNECGTQGSPQHAPVGYYRYFSSVTMSAQLDSVRIDIIAPIQPDRSR